MLRPVGAGARMDGGPWFRMDGGFAFWEGARMLGGPASAPPKAPGVNKDAMSASAALSASPQERGAALWALGPRNWPPKRGAALLRLWGFETGPLKQARRCCGARMRLGRAKDASRRLVAIGGAGASWVKRSAPTGQVAYRDSREATGDVRRSSGRP